MSATTMAQDKSEGHVMSMLVAHLHAVIKEAGMSKAELSRRTEIAYKTLCRKLAGRGELTVTDYLKIARALGVNVSTLIPKEAPA